MLSFIIIMFFTSLKSFSLSTQLYILFLFSKIKQTKKHPTKTPNQTKQTKDQ